IRGERVAEHHRQQRQTGDAGQDASAAAQRHHREDSPSLTYAHYVWPPMNLLGWMRAPEESLAQWDEHTALAAAVRADGLSRTLVCGMGGSSLVADVLAETFGVRSLQVLDSTNPDAVRATGHGDLGDTLFVISSKSGNTIETLAFYHYCAARGRPE